MFYLYTEDFCGALIGPFPDLAAVHLHIAFLLERGDADLGHVYRADDLMVDRLRQQPAVMSMTPEEDREPIPERSS